MKELFIDIETYSSYDLSSTGVYKYAESPDFEILLFGYSVDGSKVEVVDIARGDIIPSAIIEALKDNTVIKYAFNALFERVCISRFLGLPTGTYLDPSSWRCHMVWSAYLGLPLSLKGVCKVLNLEEQKMSEGGPLIRYFCIPCKATKTNGMRTRNYPYDAPDKWQIFKEYNKKDVECEIAIHNRLLKYPIPDFVWAEYVMDQEINDRGILVDEKLALNAIEISEVVNALMLEEMKEITGLDNPNSVTQLKTWLEDNKVDVDSLGKKSVETLLNDNQISNDEIKKVLGLRLKSSKSSIKKYNAMIEAKCNDLRARGMFQFYGANRTGRFSGRIIQLQNLRRNDLKELDSTRKLVKNGDVDTLTTLYQDIPDTLSQLIRTAFIPSPGYKFIVSDFSAIEARVVAWLAGETWVLDAFKANKDIYCATAEQMFHVPVEKHGVNAELRQKGKQCTLSCSYGGGKNAMIAMGALESGMKEEELEPLVESWRASNPHIRRFWTEAEKAAKKAINQKCTIKCYGLIFSYMLGGLFITLPSGRSLTYVKARIGINKYGKETIMYEGVGTTKKWDLIETFGGKLVENITQAVARDILCNSIKTLRNYRIVAHVHDELIIEVPENVSVDEITKLMAIPPSWCSDLPLKADGYECSFYKKD